jgi:surface polysaccharide O-acyltransferase-like enzyme
MGENTASTPKKLSTRDPGLDLMKAVALLWVISLHMSTWKFDIIESGWNISHVLQYSVRLLAEGVPILILVNGILLFSRKLDMKKHIRKIISLFLIFLLWAVILTVLEGIGHDEITPAYILKHVLETQNGSEFTGCLWYLQSLIGLYLIFPLLKVVYDHHRKIFCYFMGVAAFFSLMIPLTEVVLNLILHYHDNELITLTIPLIERFDPGGTGYFVFFFMLGGYIADKKDLILKHRAIWILAGTGAWIVSYLICLGLTGIYGSIFDPSFDCSSVFTVFMMLAIYCASSYVSSAAGWFKETLESIGQNTLGIFLIHSIFIRFFPLEIISQILENMGLPGRLIKLLTVFIFSWAFSVILRNIPGLKKIVSI